MWHLLDGRPSQGEGFLISSSEFSCLPRRLLFFLTLIHGLRTEGFAHCEVLQGKQSLSFWVLDGFDLILAFSFLLNQDTVSILYTPASLKDLQTVKSSNIKLGKSWIRLIRCFAFCYNVLPSVLNYYIKRGKKYNDKKTQSFSFPGWRCRNSREL